MNSQNNAAWNRYIHRLIAGEISTFTRYSSRVIQWLPREHDKRRLLEFIDAPSKATAGAKNDPQISATPESVFLLNGNLNHDFDIQAMLHDLKPHMTRSCRVAVVAYNPYLSFVYRFANRIGLRKGEMPTTFVTRTDLKNIAEISDFEMVRIRPVAYCPWRWLGIGTLINRVMPAIPILRWLSFATVILLRPIIAEGKNRPSLTVLIPARNEKGNIENALRRMPDLGCQLEIIFVEGHSNDGTWEEIQRVIPLYSNRFKILAFQQTKKGKADAVRLGFSKATSDVLTILDADLTMPPELLSRFYNAYCEGHADFVNGTRLVYPMEGEAMRFLNRLGNIFFAKALSSVLEVNLGDSLCGTKLMSRRDYERMVAWRSDFGDFDPFGDFEVIFPAAILGLGIVDIPIRYRARTYGSTNIHRFRHGLILLKMTLTGLFRIRLGVKC